LPQQIQPIIAATNQATQQVTQPGAVASSGVTASANVITTPANAATMQQQQQQALMNATSASVSAATSKPWSSSSGGVGPPPQIAGPEVGGQDKNFSVHQAQFLAQEFPKLAGGSAVADAQNSRVGVECIYGPGPNLSPQTEGSWGRGTAQGSQQVNSGSGVNGQPGQANTSPPLDARAFLPGSQINSPHAPISVPMASGNNMMPNPMQIPAHIAARMMQPYVSNHIFTQFTCANYLLSFPNRCMLQDFLNKSIKCLKIFLNQIKDL